MKISSRRASALSVAVLFLASAGLCAEPVYDLVVYGNSPAAIAAAVQARRMGASCVVVSPETRIGGLTTGGLGQTDIGNKAAFGGIALEFYRDVAAYYRDPAHWTWQESEDYSPDGQCFGTKGSDAMWTFEPSAALRILEGWERRDKLDIRRGERLDRRPGGVTAKDGRIVSFRTRSGKTFAGRVFVDATYEGDLLAAAGVSYVVGREANDVYGETISGVQRKLARNHQFNPRVSAYVRPGDPSSGLLPFVERDDGAADGSGDRRVQAYCFRMCLTDVPANRIPFARPADYDERNYELLLRNLEAIPPETFEKNRETPWRYMPWINSAMPNRKTDTNNRTGFSTDFVGQNWSWPEASDEAREKILKAHLSYQQGLVWTLANNPRVPAPIREEVAKWGTCRDEFADGLGGGWQGQLYVREARRLVGDYVMTERHCRGTETAPRPVALGAYGMDSHNVRRYVDADGFVRNEGNVEDYSANLPGQPFRRFPPFPIDYGALVPKRGECRNLLVPVCLSASHMAFGAIRMEPVFFALGQVAGTAGALAAQSGAAVQDVPYDRLRARLLADGQVVEAPVPALTVAEIAAMPRETVTARDCVVTGVVTGVFGWLRSSCSLADASNPNGPSIFVDDSEAGDAATPRAQVEADGGLAVGDVVEVRGRLAKLLLQPGVRPRRIRRVGRLSPLPPPPRRTLAELDRGLLGNSRAWLRGVVRRVYVDESVPVTLLEIGTPDGILVARLRKSRPDFKKLRDAEVEVSGIVMPCFNMRAEHLRPELELDSAAAVRVMSEPPREISSVGAESGVLTWTPRGDDGHLRRLKGVVTYVGASDGFFVVQRRDRAVRAFLEVGDYPRVGASVEVVGFPTLVDDCGAMCAAECRASSDAAGAVVPYEMTDMNLYQVLGHKYLGALDCCDRLVRIEGRVRSAERTQQGRLVLSLVAGKREQSLTAWLDGALPASAEKALVDSPRVRLTGVLDVSLARAPDEKRIVVAGESVLRLRAAEDLEILPDAAFRGRRVARCAKTVLAWLAFPLALVVAGLLFRQSRQRMVARAVSAERHRLAGELHDTISQHLSGARLLVYSVQQGTEALSAEARQALAMAGNVLEAARREVRDVVLNLQNESLLSAAPAEVLRKVAEDFGRLRSVRVRANLRGLPSEMSVVEKTDLVAIVQEAVTNAIRHGGAETVILVSDPLPDGGFALSVLNDGEPFDAATALGPEAGHFGLTGMRERANRSGFSLTFGRRDSYVEVRVEKKGE